MTITTDAKAEAAKLARVNKLLTELTAFAGLADVRARTAGGYVPSIYPSYGKEMNELFLLMVYFGVPVWNGDTGQTFNK